MPTPNYQLEWDKSTERLYETGVRMGVVYPQASNGTYPKGHAWNGLTGVTESPSGADVTKLWADDINYLSMRAAEEFGGTIEAYTYPDAFAECDGSAVAKYNNNPVNGINIGQQPRKPFGFCYRSVLGNDADLDNYGYKLHLIYGCTVTPSERAYETINDSPDAITFSWEFDTVPVTVAGHKPTSEIVLDSKKLGATKMAAIEAVLYGTAEIPAANVGDDPTPAVDARLPLPDEVISIIATTPTT